MNVLEEIPNRDYSDAVDFAKGVGRVEPGD